MLYLNHNDCQLCHFLHVNLHSHNYIPKILGGGGPRPFWSACFCFCSCLRISGTKANLCGYIVKMAVNKILCQFPISNHNDCQLCHFLHVNLHSHNYIPNILGGGGPRLFWSACFCFCSCLRISGTKANLCGYISRGKL